MLCRVSSLPIGGRNTCGNKHSLDKNITASSIAVSELGERFQRGSDAGHTQFIY